MGEYMRLMPFLSVATMLTVINWARAPLVDEPPGRSLRRVHEVLPARSSMVVPLKGDCEAAAKTVAPRQKAITGTCQFEGLGRTALAAQETLVPTPTGFEFIHVATYAMTDGDTLRSTATGTATTSATGPVLSGVLTVTGGTGRFLQATGSATMRGDVHRDSTGAVIGRWRLDGDVRY